MRVLSVATVVLYCFLETFEFPVVLQCVGERQGGEVHFKVLPDITKQILDCDTEWLVNKTVMAYGEGSGKTHFKFPILNMTANTAIMAIESDEVIYALDCPNLGINRKLLCSYPSLDPSPGTPAEQSQFGIPDWGIIVAVIIGILLLFAVFGLLIRKLVKKKPIHYAATGGNDAD